MKYFNQNDYGNVPYPSPTAPKATVKSGGCGPTCAAMIVSNLTSKVVDPKAMATYAIQKKARVSGGTDMQVLSKAIAADYGLTYATTNDESVLLQHLRSGGIAIANVGGNRPGYKGVFSDGGHYVVVAGIASDGKAMVLDPGYYAGKFNKFGRVGKVKVVGNVCYCDIGVLAKDTEIRKPAYYLFKNATKEVVRLFKDIANHWSKKDVEWLADNGIIAKADKFRPNDNITRAETAAMIARSIEYVLKQVKG